MLSVFPAFYGVILFLLLAKVTGQVNTIARYVGGGTSTGGGAAALNIRLNITYNLAWRTSNSHLFILETGFHRVRNIDTSPQGYIYAGSTTGASGYADAAGVSDSSGSVYIGDAGNCKIKKINSAYNAMTAYGSGDCGSGDASDLVGQPNSMFVSTDAFLYFPVYTYIKRIQLSSGIISTFAGSSTTAALNDGTLTVQATFVNVNGIWIDSSGNMYITDGVANAGGRIRYIASGGTTISTIGGVGTGTIDSTSTTGMALADFFFNQPMGIFGNTASSSNFAVFFFEFGTNIVRRLTAGGIFPTRAPTISPTSPTDTTQVPTVVPTRIPTVAPTRIPTVAPTHIPTVAPTHIPTVAPTHIPTVAPTHIPTVAPTHIPTVAPTHIPTVAPTHIPTVAPTHIPTVAP
eukprot:gene32360-39135_t